MSMLSVNRTLKVLNLSDGGVTDSIAKHITTGLTKNTTLVTLHIQSCKLIKCQLHYVPSPADHYSSN